MDVNRNFLARQKPININSSKKVWKSEFDQLLLSYLSKNQHMLGIIRKIFKFSVKW